MKRLFVVLLALFVLASCSDLLVEKPKSIAEEVFYNTYAEVETAVNAVYTPLKNREGLGGVYVPLLESSVDYMTPRGSYGNIGDFQGLDQTNATRTQLIWNLFYLSIRNANLVITNIDRASLTDQERSAFLAEVRFLRAFSYFNLVRNWGGVVLRNENNMAEINVPRSSAAAVFAFVEEDLLFAEQNLPVQAAIAGRPTSGSAKTLLADLYLHQERWEEARTKASEVMASGRYALVQVQDSEDFMAVFGPEVVTTPEEIFYLKFSRLGTNMGWWTVVYAHHPGSLLHSAGGFFSHYVDSELNPVYRTWDDDDLRKTYNWYAWNIGLGANTLLNKKFIDPAASSQEGAGNDYPLYRYADLLYFFAEAEARAAGQPTTAAMEAVNQVRRRAYGLDSEQPAAVDYQLADYAGLDDFLALLLREKAYEFQFEGKRWLDLKRTGRYADIILETQGKNVAQKHLLWPIPISELGFNKALDPATDQNPGY